MENLRTIPNYELSSSTHSGCSGGRQQRQTATKLGMHNSPKVTEASCIAKFSYNCRRKFIQNTPNYLMQVLVSDINLITIHTSNGVIYLWCNFLPLFAIILHLEPCLIL